MRIAYLVCLLSCFLGPITNSVLANPYFMDANSIEQAKQLARAVYSELVTAEGRPAPTLLIKNTATKAAYFDPEGFQIILEEKALRVCMTFKDSTAHAIAALLGHELSHYYLGHGFEAGFIDADSLASAISKNHERAADIKGGFIAYQAGYPSFDIMPILLARIYDTYLFPKEATLKYPSLNERQMEALAAADTVAKLSQLFDVANHLLVIDKYETAKSTYEVILTSYQGREIYNNLGICLAYEAISLFDPTELPFVYPLQIDMLSRMNTGKGDDVTERNILLAKAFTYFQTAISLDKEYTLGYIHAACVLDMMTKEFSDSVRTQTFPVVDYLYNAKLLARRAENAEHLASVSIIEGIQAAKQKQYTHALTSFEHAHKVTNSRNKFQNIIQCNLQTLNTQSSDSFSRTCSMNATSNYSLALEEIDGLEINDGARGVRTPIQLHTVKLIKKQLNEAIYLYLNVNGDRTRLLLSQNSYTGSSSLGIKIGASQKQVIEHYGLPISKTTNKGTFLVYPATKDSDIPATSIAFFIDKKMNNVQYWFTYK